MQLFLFYLFILFLFYFRGETVELGSEWKTYRLSRKPTTSFNNTKISFSFAESTESFIIKNVTIYESDCDYKKDSKQTNKQTTINKYKYIL